MKPAGIPGALEMAILDSLWRGGAGTAHEVRDRLAPQRDLAYSTVLTVLRRMEEKGMLSRSKVSRCHVYEAAIDRKEVRRSSLRELLGRCFGGSRDELLLHLVQDEKLAEDELRRLEQLLREPEAGGER